MDKMRRGVLWPWNRHLNAGAAEVMPFFELVEGREESVESVERRVERDFW
jgi:hypothetical protein